jgi:hypothetical protein
MEEVREKTYTNSNLHAPVIRYLFMDQDGLCQLRILPELSPTEEPGKQFFR